MNVRDYNILAERLDAPSQFRGAVISVHGMATRGAWQKDIQTALQDALIRHKSVDYGYRIFAVIRKGFADAVAEDILKAYEDQVRHHPSPGAIGHSFGSLAIARSLKIIPALVLRRVVLFGSIVSPDYPWDQIHANGQVDAVLNECSASDIWARLAKYAIPDSGASGVEGFKQGKAFISETDNPWTKHSGLSREIHCRKFWVPFLLG